MIILARDDREFLAGITVTHEKVGHTNQGLWHHKGMQLPAYIQHIANDLIQEKGMTTSRAVATAVSRCKVWCAGGGGVKPDTRTKACAAVAEWEKLKVESRVKKGAAERQLPALVTIPDVELLAAGTWQLSTGRQTFTRADLKHAVEAAGCPAVGAPVIKIGHLDDRFKPQDGEPALGRVANMRLDKSEMKLLGDLAGMPGWLASVSASAFPRRSIEGSYNFQCQIGHEHPFVVTALALLGVTQPGVGVLTDLEDLANLFYRASDGPREPGVTWRTGPIETEGVPMPVTEEDVRRAYYAAGEVPQTWWITELQMSPSQLVVTDGEGKIYQVPFAIQGSSVSFGEATEIGSYSDLAASRGTGPVIAYASAEESREVSAQQEEGGGGAGGSGTPEYDGDGLDSSWDDLTDLPDLSGLSVADFEAAHAALTGQQAAFTDTKGEPETGPFKVMASHPDCKGFAITDAKGDMISCHASKADAMVKMQSMMSQMHGQQASAEDVEALAKLGSGARFKALSKALGAKGASNPGALAAWIGRKKYGKAAFGKLSGLARKRRKASAETEAAGGHAVFSGKHEHPHSTFGSQGGDQTHSHSHSHSGDSVHNHAHGASAGTTQNGGTDVEFTEEQIASARASLGLEDDQELTPDLLVEGLRKNRVAASRRPSGGLTVEIDRGEWDAINARVKAAEEYQKRQQVKERDTVIAAAVRDGKFSAARKPHYVRYWDADPDGARDLIASLDKNLVPVRDIGSPGGEDDELLDDEYKTLFPPGTVKS